MTRYSRFITAKIAPQNAVYFETREEAIQVGHRPCKVCRP